MEVMKDDAAAILKAILDNTAEGIVLIDPNHKVLAFNSTFNEKLLELYNLSIEVGDDYKKFVSNDRINLFNKSFDRAMKGIPTVVSFETIVGGEVLWYEYKLNPIYLPSGELLGATLVVKNITKKKLIEVEIKEAKEKFQRIVQNSPVAKIITDHLLNITEVNSALEKLLGYSRAELLTMKLDNLSANVDLDVDFFHPENSYDINKVSSIKRKDGSIVFVECDMNVFEQGEKGYAIITLLDISGRLEYESNLRKANHELNLLNETNDIIIETEVESELLDKICECFVKIGGYQLAWICFRNRINLNGSLKAIHAFGNTEYLNNIEISETDPKTNNGPTATVLQTGKIVVTNNFRDAPNFNPWRETAEKFNLSSSCVLPIFLEKKVVGALNIYSERVDAFDKHELKILERISRNLSIAISNIRLRQEKTKAVYDLNERIKEISTIYKVTEILERNEVDLETNICEMIQSIPKGWQFPDCCGAKISFNNKIFQSSSHLAPFKDKMVACGITMDLKPVVLEVGYLENFPETDEDPFLKEERDLLETLMELFISHYNHRLAIEDLKKSEANLRSVFENTAVGHLLVDSSYQVVSFNQTMYLGYGMMCGIELVIGSNIAKQERKNNKSTIVPYLQKVEKERVPVSFEIGCICDETPHSFSISITPILVNTGFLGFSISAIEITDRKNLEQERETIIRELTNKNAELEQFSYILSHNIRSPIATLLGLTYLLSGKITSKEKATILDGIKRSAGKLDSVIKDVNEVLRVKKTLAQTRNEIDLNERFIAASSYLSEDISKSGAKITTDFSACPVIFSHQTYINSIFQNLISNSIKYARKGVPPEIKITSRKKKSFVELRFSDNGIGIDLQKHGKEIFGLYKKFNFEVEGKGMGLFMVRSQVKALGGNIEIESELGKGTTIIILIPVK